MRKKLLAGNWKMNKGIKDLAPFFKDFGGEIGLSSGSSPLNKVDVLFAVPFLQLAEARKITAGTGIRIAAQNVHFEASGAFTGEISVSMLKEIGVDATLIGHSERRQYFGETDTTVMKKVQMCLDNGVTPIICIGETKEERQSGVTNEVLSRQVSAVLEVIAHPEQVIFAYEPVWAIGTGLTATNEQAQEAHAFIRSLLTKKYQDEAQKVQILYGGSANPANIDGLLQQPDIDGGLVGGASLKPADFATMVKAALKLS
jgi:triosephosphate isomerase